MSFIKNPAIINVPASRVLNINESKTKNKDYTLCPNYSYNHLIDYFIRL